MQIDPYTALHSPKMAIWVRNVLIPSLGRVAACVAGAGLGYVIAHL